MDNWYKQNEVYYFDRAFQTWYDSFLTTKTSNCMQILDQLAIKHQTDKASTHHNYTEVYEKYLEPLRDQSIVLVELGWGGYEFPDRGGQSARMWLDYFPVAKIICVEIHKKTNLPDDSRFSMINLSQDDKSLPNLIGEPDVIIDDASHHNPETIRSFEMLFPKLKSGGLYFVEDIDSSWAEWAEGDPDWSSVESYTTVNYFRRSVNDVNNELVPHYTQQFEVKAIHFYKNLIVIEKL